MLQQTQVARVTRVYRRFLDRFPTPSALAAAEAAEVILAWEDLGYLRRAHHLRRAAEAIDEQGWPTTPEGLVKLPGVGPYTAAAVASFAFGHQVAAVDTNLVRVLSRWIGRLLTTPGARDVAAGAIDRDRPADWNQAMMDLGATRCRPRAPDCATCPVAEWCTDPTIETTVAHQGAYPGSVRQARAAVLKHLAARGATDRTMLAAALRLDVARVDAAVEGLVADGLVDPRGGIVTLA